MNAKSCNNGVVLIVFLLAITASSYSYADIYKNVDNNGQVTYSDVPLNSSSEKVRVVSPTSSTTTAPRTTTTNKTTSSLTVESNAPNATGVLPVVTPKSTTANTSKSTTGAAKATVGGVSGASAGGASASGGAGSSAAAKASTTAAAKSTSTVTTPTVTTPTVTTPTVTTPTVTTPTVTDAVSATYKKWHPGHYLLVYPQGAESDEQHNKYLQVVFSEIKSNPGFQGVQKQYFWEKLEPTKDYYDFSQIKRDLAELKKINKRLVVSIQERSFITKVKHVPSYLLSTEYEGGVYPINNNNGFNAAYYNTNVQERLIKLVQAMGKQLDSYPNLEAINFEETAHSMSSSLWSRDISKRYYTGVVKLALAAEKAFPTTVVIQYINYADSNLLSIFEDMLNNGVAVGGPDVYENNPYLATASYSYFPRVAGLIPIGMAVQYHNYQSSIGGSASIDPPPISSIHKFAKDNLHANYMFWLRRDSLVATTNYYKHLIDYFKTIDWEKDPAGGLNTQCPYMFKKCMEN